MGATGRAVVPHQKVMVKERIHIPPVNTSLASVERSGEI